MKWFKFWLAALFVCCCQAGWSAHLVGGEFQITYKGNFVYEIQLNVYGDNATLGPGNQDAIVDVAIFERGTNNLVETFPMSLMTTAFVPYINQQCVAGSVQTKILTYRLTRTLAPNQFYSPNGYYISWERCCRNQDIVNLLNPSLAGFVYYAEFPAVVRPNGGPMENSSPVLPPMPPDVLCVNELYQYSMQASDPDGDSLVYKMSEPMNGFTYSGNPKTQFMPGPYPLITWRPPFGLNTQINGTPRLNIHPETGLISVKPNLSGIYVFAITVEEWRDGKKIGEVRRDIQVKVANCPVNNEPTISLRPPGATQDYQPGDTLFVTDATDYCYQLRFTDPDIGQQVSIKVEPVNFTQKPVVTPTVGTIQQVGQVLTAQICWADCNVNSPNQLYKVNLIVTDNPCGKFATDTLELSFLVVPKPNALPQIVAQNVVNGEINVNVGDALKFNLLSTDADKDELTLHMTGKGFNPEAEGMQLGPKAGKESLLSAFTWTPTCEQQNRREFYDVNFIVKDNSCFPNHADTVSVRLRVRELEDQTIFLPPNIFTPNNDQRNDFFVAPTLPLDKCDDTFQEIRIFNRWGQQVYRSASRQFAWDGNNVSDGVYFYTIKYQKKKYKGHITIVR